MKNFSINLSLSLTIIALSSFYISNAQSITYVTETGAGNQDGSSWGNAKNANALPILTRDTNRVIWIAAGIYKPNAIARDSSFIIGSNTKIYGGFAGNESTLSQRNIDSNLTILSGDIGIANDTSDNSLHVVVFYNSQNSVLDGVTITQGNANVENPNYPEYSNQGGGIYILTKPYQDPVLGFSPGHCTPTIKNCKIIQNYATVGAAGALILGFGVTEPIIDSCTFKNNFAGNGGAAAVVSSISSGTNPTFNHCLFQNNNNSLENNGGALLIRSNSSEPLSLYDSHPIVKNCVFKENKDGAILLNTSNGGNSFIHTLIDSCQFFNNSTQSGSSVIQIKTLWKNASAKISNCTFHHNQINDAPEYAAIGISTGNSINHINDEFGVDTILNCIFHDNNVYNAIIIEGFSTAIDSTYIANCLFYNQSSSLQQIILSEASDGGITNTIVTNSSFIGNRNAVPFLMTMIKNATGVSPGAPFGYPDAHLTIQNSILKFLYADTTSISNHCIQDVHYGSGGTSSLITKNSMVQFQTTTWPADAGINGGGNLVNQNPDFMDTANYNFRLGCNSPAVDAGNSALLSGYLQKDLDGNARVYGANVDMGCYEQQGTPLPLSFPIISVDGMTITCRDSSNMSINSAEWNFGDGATSNLDSVSHTYSTKGTYTVCLTIHTECGSADSCLQIEIGNSQGLSTLSPFSKITAYPNPTSDQIAIDHIPFSCNYSIVSVLGKTVESGVLHSGTNWLEFSKFAAGIYYLRLSHEGMQTRSLKIMKK